MAAFCRNNRLAMFGSSAIVLLVGAVLGAVVTIDPWLSHTLPLDPFFFFFGFRVPFLLSITTFLVACISCALFFHSTRLFVLREKIAVALIVLPVGFSGVGYGPLHLTHVSMLIVIFFFICSTFVERKPFASPLPLVLFMLLIACFLLGSAINGLIVSIISLYTVLTKVIAVLIVTSLITSIESYRFALKCFIFIAIVSAVVAVASEIVYLVSGYPFTMDELPQFHFKETPFGKMLRVTAFMSSTQNLAHLVIVGSCLVVFSDLSFLQKSFSVVVMATAVAFTFSSGAYLVLATLLVLAVFLNKPNRSPAYISLLALTGITVYQSGVFKFVYEHFLARMSDKNVGDRIAYIQAGIEGIKRHPLLGIGFKNIGRYLHTPIHNAYLQIMTDVGIIGGLVFAAFMIYLLATSAVEIASLEGSDKNMAKGVFLGMCGVSTHFLFEPFFDNILSWIFMGLVALLPLINGRKAGKTYETQLRPA